MDNELLVKSIRELCKKNNIAISQLEGELKFGAGLISRWTKNSPSLDKIVDIADYFHVTLDEVVGYKPNMNDTFLNTLYEKTSNGSIVWEDSETMNKRGLMVKQYSKFFAGGFIDDEYKETTYATCFNSGYIAMYVYHFFDQILHPIDIILFIQPTDSAFLVDQHYTKEELIGLWIKILNNLGDDTPDPVKAEDLKNEFISNHSLTNGTNKIANKKDSSDIEKALDNPSIMKMMEMYNRPEFQELQKTFSSPEFQAAVEAANKIQKYLNPNKK